jgi:hypothetical protein
MKNMDMEHSWKEHAIEQKLVKKRVSSHNGTVIGFFYNHHFLKLKVMNVYNLFFSFHSHIKHWEIFFCRVCEATSIL